MIRLFNQDARVFIEDCEDEYDCIFMDPPDNIGLKYHGVLDKKDDYYGWLEHLIMESMLKCKVLWISYYWKHDIEIKYLVRRILHNYHPSWTVKNFIWKFNFGQHCYTDCGSGYRNILRLARYDWNWNTDAIKVESVRQQVNDPRAAKGGKVPLDVWEFPRVTGNSTERRSWHPTQHPEALLTRLYKLSNCKTVLDLFVGSGTSIRVCKRLNIDLDCVELSDYYCEQLEKEHKILRSK